MRILAYETLGSDQAPALLMVHGFMSSNAQWQQNQAALASQYRLVLVELFGHGQSGMPAEPDEVTIARYLEQFELIRQELQIERWAVLGQSFGAGLVIHYGLQHPKQTRALIVTNSRSAFGKASAPGRTAVDRTATRTLTSDDFDRRKLPYHPIHARRFPAALQARMVAAADRIPREAIRAAGALSRQLNCTARLGALQPPIVLINGVFERAFQSDVADLQARYAQLECVNLQGGHSINIEAPEPFDQAVLGFLEQHHR